MKKIYLMIAFASAISAQAFAQSVSSTATSTATIVTPLTITKTVDMNFGNLAVNATAGTLVLSPAGGRTITGGVSISAGFPGTVTAASFTVNGQGAYTYAITLPAASSTLTNPALNTMTASTWTSTPTPTGTLTAGTQTLNVGATLNVAASQATGVYVTGTPFTVSVVYN